MATEGLTYTQYVSSLTNPQAVQYMLDLETAVNNGQISQYEFSQAVESVTGKAIKPHRAYNGDILGYTLETVETSTVNNPINSNASTVSRGTVARPVTSTVNSGGKAVIQGLRGVGAKAATGAALVGTAAMCVSAGITLGKTVDSVLYNLNPDFWDSNGMSTLNPETWSALTAGDDSLGASLINVLFGFDETNEAGQAYIDETALAYYALWMNGLDLFNNEVIDEVVSSDLNFISPLYVNPVSASLINVSYTWGGSGTIFATQPIELIGAPTYNMSLETLRYGSLSSIDFKITVMPTRNANNRITCVVSTTANLPSNAQYQVRKVRKSDNKFDYSISGGAYQSYTYDSKTVKYYTFDLIPSTDGIPPYTASANQYTSSNWNYAETAWNQWFSTIDEQSTSPYDGIDNQTGATLPDTSSWQDIPSTLTSLQSQYPDLWNNAIQYPVIQDDGSTKTYTYVPVAMPEFNNRTDPQPTSGDATQTNTEISPSTMPQELIDALTKILTNPMPETAEDLDDDLPPENPTDTGDGSSPVPIVPVGSASAMWKIYHPTQAQIDSFGGWLWSSDFIDQILKIFNNPMEAVIGLHKVYATPIDAGNTTIKVGYLDSQVPSAYIEQQYITVDCGSVSLSEQFGNVFDYSPFTDVQLYLPFVGIVPLNVADVMRSTINIKYGVDVITGACLAQVKVSRDNNNSILYQYSGNCAVQYPISSGSYMGIVSSIISVAGGIAATVATGGGAAPLALGAAGGLLNAHTNVQHSGGFSGNAGAMGGKIPYLIITRPQTKVALNAEAMQGYSSNSYTTIGECSGYIKADSVHVINVNATDEEMTEINNLILSGIII